jgi:dihydropyrimidine dehydrogenase (NAD+) subunit PreA
MAKAPRPHAVGVLAGGRVPWVDEEECVGCNLCRLVCPVEACITMREVGAERRDTWNDRLKDGRDHVPGGLERR